MMLLRKVGLQKLSLEKLIHRHFNMVRRRMTSSVNRDGIKYRYENFSNRRTLSTGLLKFNDENTSEVSQIKLLQPRTSAKSDKPLTPDQKHNQMYSTAMVLLSLQDPKVYVDFLRANESSADYLLIWNCRKVIKHYADPNRFLPLEGFNSSKYQKGLVLHGPQLCHSLLTSVLIPHFISRESSIPEKYIDDFIDMGLMTVQSLGKLCLKSNPNNRKSKLVANVNTPVGDLLQFGDLAEELLRLLLNTNINTPADGKSNSISRKTTQLFNSTLNTWTTIASSERDYQASKNAALRSEKLLLDLALSQRSSNNELCLLDFVQPDTVSFNSVIQSWSKSGKYEVINGQKIDRTTTLAAERAEAILQLMQDMSGSTIGTGNSVVYPNNLSYELTIQAWSRSLDQNASDRALNILVKMLEKFHERGDRHLPNGTRPFPSRKTFSNVLKALAASHRDDCTMKGEALFQHMKKLGDQGYVQCKPDTIAYNSLLSIYLQNINRILSDDSIDNTVKINDVYENCLRMDEIINEMKDMFNLKDKITKEKTWPDIATYRIVGRAWIFLSSAVSNEKNSSCGSLEESLERSDTYLRTLASELERESGSHSINIGFDKMLFDEMFSIYNRCGYCDKGMELLNAIRDSPSDVGLSMQKDKIEMLTRNGAQTPENALEADEVLKGITKYSVSKAQQPNGFIVRSVFNAYSKALESKDIEWKDGLAYLKRMEQLLKQMESIHDRAHVGREGKDKNESTIVTASNVLLRSYIKAMEISSADCKYLVQKAEDMLQMRSKDSHCAPADSYTYTQMMILLAKSKLPNASEKALQILEQIRNNADIKLDSYFFNSALKALTANPGFEVHCEHLLNDLENGTFFKTLSDKVRIDETMPDKIAYNTLMTSYTSKGTFESAKSAEDLFIRLSNKNTPDTYSLNTLLKAWCNVGTLSSIERAEAILSKSLSLDCFYDQSKFQDDSLQRINVYTKPDSVSFTTIIQAYCKLRDKEAADNAYRVLRLREHFCDTDRSMNVQASDYTNVINKYGRHYNVKKSEEILNRLLLQAELHSKIKIKDNLFHPIKLGKDFVMAFNSVLKNYSSVAERLDVIDKVTSILDDMYIELCKPDGYTYHYILTAISKSSNRSKKERVYELMDAMLEGIIQRSVSGSGRKSFRPSIEHFHIVLNGCKHAKDHVDPLTTAILRYRQIRDNSWNIKPTDETYGIMIEIFKKHFRDEESRNDAMSRLFLDCCKDGNLSEFCVRSFRDGFTSQQDFDNLLKDTLQSTEHIDTSLDTIHIESLPHEWTRNRPKING
jgi:hypothetical protein